MAVLKIIVLFLFHALQLQIVSCQDFSAEKNVQDSIQISTIVQELTHVRTKNLSGNVNLSSLEVFQTNPESNKLNVSEEQVATQATWQNENERAENQTEDTENQQRPSLLSEVATKVPTDGGETVDLMDVFNSTSGTTPYWTDSVKLIITTPSNSELINDASKSTQFVTENSTVFGNLTTSKPEVVEMTTYSTVNEKFVTETDLSQLRNKIVSTTGALFEQTTDDFFGMKQQLQTDESSSSPYPEHTTIEDLSSFMTVDEEFLSNSVNDYKEASVLNDVNEDISTIFQLHATNKINVETTIAFEETPAASATSAPTTTQGFHEETSTTNFIGNNSETTTATIASQTTTHQMLSTTDFGQSNEEKTSITATTATSQYEDMDKYGFRELHGSVTESKIEPEKTTEKIGIEVGNEKKQLTLSTGDSVENVTDETKTEETILNNELEGNFVLIGVETTTTEAQYGGNQEIFNNIIVDKGVVSEDQTRGPETTLTTDNIKDASNEPGTTTNLELRRNSVLFGIETATSGSQNVESGDKTEGPDEALITTDKTEEVDSENVTKEPIITTGLELGRNSVLMGVETTTSGPQNVGNHEVLNRIEHKTEIPDTALSHDDILITAETNKTEDMDYENMTKELESAPSYELGGSSVLIGVETTTSGTQYQEIFNNIIIVDKGVVSEGKTRESEATLIHENILAAATTDNIKEVNSENVTNELATTTNLELKSNSVLIPAETTTSAVITVETDKIEVEVDGENVTKEPIITTSLELERNSVLMGVETTTSGPQNVDNHGVLNIIQIGMEIELKTETPDTALSHEDILITAETNKTEDMDYEKMTKELESSPSDELERSSVLIVVETTTSATQYPEIFNNIIIVDKGVVREGKTKESEATLIHENILTAAITDNIKEVKSENVTNQLGTTTNSVLIPVETTTSGDKTTDTTLITVETGKIEDVNSENVTKESRMTTTSELKRNTVLTGVETTTSGTENVENHGVLSRIHKESGTTLSHEADIIKDVDSESVTKELESTPSYELERSSALNDAETTTTGSQNTDNHGLLSRIHNGVKNEDKTEGSHITLSPEDVLFTVETDKNKDMNGANVTNETETIVNGAETTTTWNNYVDNHVILASESIKVDKDELERSLIEDLQDSIIGVDYENATRESTTSSIVTETTTGGSQYLDEQSLGENKTEEPETNKSEKVEIHKIREPGNELVTSESTISKLEDTTNQILPELNIDTTLKDLEDVKNMKAPEITSKKATLITSALLTNNFEDEVSDNVDNQETSTLTNHQSFEEVESENSTEKPRIIPNGIDDGSEDIFSTVEKTPRFLLFNSKVIIEKPVETLFRKIKINDVMLAASRTQHHSSKLDENDTTGTSENIVTVSTTEQLVTQETVDDINVDSGETESSTLVDLTDVHVSSRRKAKTVLFSTKVGDKEIRSSINIINNEESFYIPSDASVTFDNPNKMTISWKSNFTKLNNSLEVEFGRSIRLNMIKDNRLHSCRSELIFETRNKSDGGEGHLITLDDGVQIHFSNAEFLRTALSKENEIQPGTLSSAGSKQKLLVAEITGGCLGVSVIVGIIAYMGVKMFKGKTRSFKPNHVA